MSYKRIMVPVNGVDDAGHALELAFDLGKRFGGEVMGIHAAAETSSILPYMGESMSGAMVENMITALDSAADAHLQAARAAFAAAQQASGSVAGQLAVHRGLEDDVLTRHGRLADLVIVPRPASKTALSESPTMQAAIMDTGRPVLVAPPGQAKALGGKILVAWNGSPQAARALAAALPLVARGRGDHLVAYRGRIGRRTDGRGCSGISGRPWLPRPGRVATPAGIIRWPMPCCWRR